MSKINFESLGFSPQFADDGEAVLEIINRQSFDLIFMDLSMPKLDGFETAQAINQQKGLKRPKIIAFSDDQSPGLKQRCIQSGMDDVCAKGCNSKQLKSMINKWSH